MLVFQDRADAGRRLAERLRRQEMPPGAAADLVVGLTNGGVPVAREVARGLGLPLDILAVRRITAPGNPDLAAGVVAEGLLSYREDLLGPVAADEDDTVGRELAGEVRRWLTDRAAALRGTCEPAEIAGRRVVVVDDGMITGATAQAAVTSLRRRGAASVLVAVPVAPPLALARLRPLVESLLCLESAPVRTVDAWYVDYPPVGDDEVTRLLETSVRRLPPEGDGGPGHRGPGEPPPPVEPRSDGTSPGHPERGAPAPQAPPVPEPPHPGKPEPGEPEPGKPGPGEPEPGKPGPGAPRASHPAPEERRETMTTRTTAAEHSRTKAWDVRLYLTEDPDTTTAWLRLYDGHAIHESTGVAHRNPDDPQVPYIGDDFAVGRALIDLGHQLLRSATIDSAGADSARHRTQT